MEGLCRLFARHGTSTYSCRIKHTTSFITSYDMWRYTWTVLWFVGALSSGRRNAKRDKCRTPSKHNFGHNIRRYRAPFDDNRSEATEESEECRQFTRWWWQWFGIRKGAICQWIVKGRDRTSAWEFRVFGRLCRPRLFQLGNIDSPSMSESQVSWYQTPLR